MAHGEITYPAHSPNIIESKSMKLYFNGFNSAKLSDQDAFIEIVSKDLAARIGTSVQFKLWSVEDLKPVHNFSGWCLDNLDVVCDHYTPTPEFLTCGDILATEELYSNLLKSNCAVTLQPDWASIYIKYNGKKIDHAGLLKYIISLREHNEFHEQCVERIFNDIMTRCCPRELTVYARYTRRGGIDINPYRTSNKNFAYQENIRLNRQ